MLTVQLPRVNLFPIYCQVRRPDFCRSFLKEHLYHGNINVAAPRNLSNGKCSDHFLISVRTRYFNFLIFDSVE